jgi:putative transposase
MMTIAFKGNHFERDVILWGVRWYVAYPLSYRQIEEMMEERGVEVDHSTLNRWALKYVSVLEKAFLARKRPVWTCFGKVESCFWSGGLPFEGGRADEVQ